MTSTIAIPRWRLGRVAPAIWLTSAITFVAVPIPTGAQNAPPGGTRDAVEAADFSEEVPAHVAVVDGRATLTRDGSVFPAEENVPLLAGDRLTTTRGRLEVLFSDGSAFDLDEDTSLDLLSDQLLRLHEGRLRILIARSTNKELDYRVDTAGGTALLRVAGEYRVSLDTREPPQVDLAVFRGVAELVNNEGRTTLRAGTHAYASERVPPSPAYTFNSAVWDPLDRWANEQYRERYGEESAQYLPADLRHYGGAFDEYGTWGYLPTYGNVWYPRVHAGWRPYSAGYWSHTRPYGWFWVGGGRWTWPTHHYGRWNYGGGAWFWTPGYHFGPAWVSWAYTPSYVGWCPLGYNGYASIGFGGYYNPWLAWSVVPYHAFVQPIYVHTVHVAHVLIPETYLTPVLAGQFVVATNAPPVRVVTGTAVPRPIRAPTARTREIISTGNGQSLAAGPVSRQGVSRDASGEVSRSPVGATGRTDRAAVGRNAVPDRSTGGRIGDAPPIDRAQVGPRPGADAPLQTSPPSSTSRGPMQRNDAAQGAGSRTGEPDRGTSRSEAGRGAAGEAPPPSTGRSRSEVTGTDRSAPPKGSTDAPPPSRAEPPATKTPPPAPPASKTPPSTGRGGGGTEMSRRLSATAPRQPSTVRPTPRPTPSQPLEGRTRIPSPVPQVPAEGSERRSGTWAYPPGSPQSFDRSPAPSQRYTVDRTPTPSPSPRYSAPGPRPVPTPSPRYSSPVDRSSSYSSRASAPQPMPRYSAPAPRPSPSQSMPRYSSPAPRPSVQPRSSAPMPSGGSRMSPPSSSGRAPAVSRPAAPSGGMSRSVAGSGRGR